MAKLYPPHIEGSLPAFTGTYMRIPFVGSRAVSFEKDVREMVIQIKDIQTSNSVITSPVPKSCITPIDRNGNTYEIEVNPGGSFNLGQHYKVQLAYKDISGTVGYFSDVGIIKYIQAPTVILDGIGTTHSYTYTLKYTCSDPTEKLYSTIFVLFDADTKDIIDSSNEIIHNTLKDTNSTTAYESYDFLQELDVSKNYEIMAYVKTSSGYETSTKRYPISAAPTIPMMNTLGITAELDYDNGCINIGAYGKNSTISGSYKIARADSNENYSIWHVMTSLDVSMNSTSQINPGLLWRDFTIEQGVNYMYALYQTNSSLNFSNKVTTNTIYADFEDSFLFDGQHQLRIRFDPKMSSFKINVQEAKTDTIGGQYPIIQRNGQSYYREFPIAGLLSHLSDPSGYFDAQIAQIKELDNTYSHEGQNYQTNLNSYNVALERRYKMEVLAWLNNGKPKLFRSPSEGNFLIRLLNVSLSPVDSLGRMLHNFSGTAYEIAPATPEEMIKEEYKILQPQNLSGIINYEDQKGVASFHLDILNDGSNLIENPTLQNKDIVGASFYRAYKPNQTLNVKINGVDQNIYKKDTYEGKITSLTKGTSAFNPDPNDLVLLSYRNVLSLSGINDKIKDANSTMNNNQYLGGWSLQGTFSCLRNFITQILKLICKPREVIHLIIDGITVSINWLRQVIDKLLNFKGNETLTFDGIAKTALEWIKTWIKNAYHGSCIESFIYELKIEGTICGYFDAKTNKIITAVNNAKQALVSELPPCLTYIYEKANDVVQNIYSEFTLYSKDIPSTITNLVANPFTCVELFYKAQENLASLDWANSNPNSLLNLSDCYCGNTNLAGFTSEIMSTLKSSNQITGSLVSTCTNLLDSITTSLSSGTLSLNSGTPNQTSLDQLNQYESSSGSTVKDISNAAINVLTSITSGSTTTQSIINISKNVLSGTFNAVSGLFGGMC